jgi:hypothetical protein
MKKERRTPEWHAPRSPKGSGDFYGQGVKNPIGKVVRSYIDQRMSSKKLGTPPRSLA